MRFKVSNGIRSRFSAIMSKICLFVCVFLRDYLGIFLNCLLLNANLPPGIVPRRRLAGRGFDVCSSVPSAQTAVEKHRHHQFIRATIRFT